MKTLKILYILFFGSGVLQAQDLDESDKAVLPVSVPGNEEISAQDEISAKEYGMLDLDNADAATNARSHAEMQIETAPLNPIDVNSSNEVAPSELSQNASVTEGASLSSMNETSKIPTPLKIVVLSLSISPEVYNYNSEGPVNQRCTRYCKGMNDTRNYPAFVSHELDRFQRPRHFRLRSRRRYSPRWFGPFDSPFYLGSPFNLPGFFADRPVPEKCTCQRSRRKSTKPDPNSFRQSSMFYIPRIDPSQFFDRLNSPDIVHAHDDPKKSAKSISEFSFFSQNNFPQQIFSKMSAPMQQASVSDQNESNIPRSVNDKMLEYILQHTNDLAKACQEGGCVLAKGGQNLRENLQGNNITFIDLHDSDNENLSSTKCLVMQPSHSSNAGFITCRANLPQQSQLSFMTQHDKNIIDWIQSCLAKKQSANIRTSEVGFFDGSKLVQKFPFDVIDCEQKFLESKKNNLRMNDNALQFEKAAAENAKQRGRRFAIHYIPSRDLQAATRPNRKLASHRRRTRAPTAKSRRSHLNHIGTLDMISDFIELLNTTDRFKKMMVPDNSLNAHSAIESTTTTTAPLTPPAARDWTGQIFSPLNIFAGAQALPEPAAPAPVQPQAPTPSVSGAYPFFNAPGFPNYNVYLSYTYPQAAPKVESPLQYITQQNISPAADVSPHLILLEGSP